MPPARLVIAGPERIVRRGDEDLVALVEQRLHRHRDELGDTVPEVHVVGVEPREALDLSYRLTTARRAETMPLLSLYPWAVGSAASMSRTIWCGASKPKIAGLPVFSLRI